VNDQRELVISVSDFFICTGRRPQAVGPRPQGLGPSP
jgi:hypothetical protein